MDVVLYTGNAASPRTISGAGFQPDFIWDKSRSARSHTIWDSVRGVGVSKELSSNLTDAEGGANISTAVQGYISAITADGFTMTSGSSTINAVNANGENFVAWLWNAGGSTVTNTSGTISAQVRANATAGFSVVTYTGTSAVSATVGHGLNVAPKFVIVKQRTSAGGTLYNWNSYHEFVDAAPADYFISLNTTNGKSLYTLADLWSRTKPTSSVFTLGSATGGANTINNFSGTTYVAYCFAAVAGYSAFGSYTGNGVADGSFVFLGFRPRWLMIKNSSSAGNHWIIIDTARDTYNLSIYKLGANTSAVENDAATVGTSANNMVDILSNGFKLRSTNGDTNGGGTTYIFAAFAENPFKNSLAR